jgi:enoyl-CoA hydratase/carnithine racemase
VWDQLRRAGEALAENPPGAVILTGAGEHFSAGMDLSPQNTLLMEVAGGIAQHDEVALRGLIERLKQTTHVWTTVGCPVVAAIEGACVGAGLELVLAADVRVASTSARLGLPEATLGMVPDVGGTVRLTRLVGTSRATQMILTGELISANLALSWGLVDELCAPGDALIAARSFVGRLRATPVAGREALALIRAVDELGDQSFNAETEAGVRALLSGEVLQVMAARSARH